MNKNDRSLEALLALAFRTPLSEKEIEEFFSEPVDLPEELKKEIDSWITDPSTWLLATNHKD